MDLFHILVSLGAIAYGVGAIIYARRSARKLDQRRP